MTDEQFFCASCGHDSRSKEICTHCGQKIDDLYETPPGFSPSLWGRLTLRVDANKGVEQFWQELAEVWQDKVEAFTPHKDSQLEQFDTSADTVELYGADYMADIMREALGTRGTLDFQELSREQMPQRTPYKPLRPPTVPRHKR